MKITTNRLTLASPHEIDGATITVYLTRNKDFLREFEPNRPKEYYTEEYQREQLNMQINAWDDQKGYRFYLSLKENENIIIGFAALSEIIMGSFCSCFLGYQLDHDHINQGLMTEAVNAVVRFAFDELGLHRIEANIMPKNIRSVRVVEKCGFVNEGTAKKYLRINGIWEDHTHYVILNEDVE